MRAFLAVAFLAIPAALAGASIQRSTNEPTMGWSLEGPSGDMTMCGKYRFNLTAPKGPKKPLFIFTESPQAAEMTTNKFVKLTEFSENVTSASFTFVPQAPYVYGGHTIRLLAGNTFGNFTFSDHSYFVRQNLSLYSNCTSKNPLRASATVSLDTSAPPKSDRTGTSKKRAIKYFN
ncbi:hypothetical protein T439DRAFT_356713 [Meredithblackwellia eburnea MCA 4105]